ncbi:MAG: GNAT family N-acetyltransferase [Verrucomicrobiota bacterium]|jgi:hypothetical protein
MPDTGVNTQRTTPLGRLEQPVTLDPLQYPGWDSVVAAHPGGSFFHLAAWARVLQDTYGHRPFYLCRFADGQLEELLPLMEVASPWTGRRGVSLPFTDFCPPLGTRDHPPRMLYESALECGRQRRWRYLECRSSSYGWLKAPPSLAFYGHRIDLERGPEALFQGCDAAARRGVRKAEAAGLKVEFTNRPESVRTFYALHCRTRQRHGVPPQPFRFFENIARHVLGQGLGVVETVRLQDRPVAAAVFFHSGRQALYKFGASDYEFQVARPNNLLMWEAIKRYAADGFATLHLGRTSLADAGLRRFKLGFGAREERLEYYKYDFPKQAFVADKDRAEGPLNSLFRCLPGLLLRLAGQALYPHLS